jgi:hypothetical protein
MINKHIKEWMMQGQRDVFTCSVSVSVCLHRVQSYIFCLKKHYFLHLFRPAKHNLNRGNDRLSSKLAGQTFSKKKKLNQE